MKIVRFASGLGNVMFQYALYMQVCKLFPDEKIYVDTIFYKFTGYPFEFSDIFNIKFDNDFCEYYAAKYEVDLSKELKELAFWEKYGVGYMQFGVDYPNESAELNFEELPGIYKEQYPNLKVVSDLPMSINRMEKYIREGDRILSKRRKIRHVLENKLSNNHAILLSFLLAVYSRNGRKRIFSQLIHLRKPDFCSFAEKQRLYVEGDVYYNLYGNPMDCEGVRDNLIKAFEFPPLDEENERIRDRIINVNAVAIHARVKHFEYGMGAILKRNYYKKAMKYIRKKDKNKLTFFIFSDDMEWCKKNKEFLGLSEKEDIIWVDGNQGKDAYKDMQLMSYCKYFIIPNSTFSWWAGYLSQREGKIMITPYATLPGTVSL